MSLINDALIKAERDRAEAALAPPGLTPRARAAHRREARKFQSMPFIIVNSVALMALFAIVLVVLFRNRDLPASAAEAETVAVAAPAPDPAVALAVAPAESEAASPFLPDTPATAEPTPTNASTSDRYVLTGMTELGRDTLLSVLNVQDQRSVWIAVGKSSGGITVESYDPTTDRAVIRVNNQTLTLGMRQGSPVEQAAAE